MAGREKKKKDIGRSQISIKQKCVPIFHRTSSDSDKITMEEDYDIAETNDDINVTLSDNFENENITKHVFHEYHDYSYDDMPTKIHHLMYSDTLIVVISLIIMIIVGLVFRTCCLKLTSCNQRKERVRGGLRQLADHMHHVTRSMANDLELPDSPKTVIRTYSNPPRPRSCSSTSTTTACWCSPSTTTSAPTASRRRRPGWRWPPYPPRGPSTPATFRSTTAMRDGRGDT